MTWKAGDMWVAGVPAIQARRSSATRTKPRQWLAAILLLAMPGCSRAQPNGDVSSLLLERTIPLVNVTGRIDHLAADARQGRIFVAELGNGSVDDIDLKSRTSRRITGLKSPQGLAYLAARDEIVVASGGDGSVRFFDGATLAPTARILLGSDADNVRVDEATGQIVVGYGSGALAVIDAAHHDVIRTIVLPAHPEGFTIDPKTRLAFVNLPDDRSIVVVNLDNGALVARWPASHLLNFPMTHDQQSKVLAIVYRMPRRLVLIDETSGMVKQDLPTCGDADDIHFDQRRLRLYVSCGSGIVDVFQKAEGVYSHRASIATQRGARTAIFLPEQDRLIVATRAEHRQTDAGLLVFRPGPS